LNGRKASVAELRRVAHEVRKLVIATVHTAANGHIGGSLSETDLLTALFFRVMDVDTENPRKRDRDRFVLSKGHSTPGYYAVLARRGFFPLGELDHFDELGSRLQGHPDMHKTPGVDISSGSLGQGLSCAIGMALGNKADGTGFTTFVLIGDGESQEGQVWEAALYAGALRVPSLVAIVDNNGVQLSARTKDVVSVEPLEAKWEAFGWTVLSCDGHDMDQVVATLEKAKADSVNGPVAVIARTVKGKGVSFMEGRHEWHGKAPNDEEFRIAMAELEAESVTAGELIHEVR
jgi:transketolase